MRWRKRGLWIVCITITGMLLLLILRIWIPVSMADAYEATPGSAMSGTITAQTTPTEDATVTALQKEKLTQEVEQLKAQNAPDLLGRVQTNAVLLSTLVVVVGGLIGLFRWAADRRSEREKRAEEGFQAAVTGLGDDNELTRINAAILLRNFLHPGYERFSTQIFELAIAHLRLPRTSGSPTGSNVPLLLTPRGQKLVAVFIEAFPLARRVSTKNPLPLDATGIQLDSAHLERVDLKQVKMPRAFLRRAKLRGADLRGADLREADLSGADLREANLSDANLSGADLSDTNLSGAKLISTKLISTCLAGVDLSFADLSFANLRGVYLSDAKLKQAQFFRANLSEAYLCRVDFSEVDLKEAVLREADLRETNLSDADLSRARLRDATLRVADLSRADLSRADLSRADLSDANLSFAKLNGARLQGARLRQTNFNEADLSFASFIQAHFSGADRGNAELCEVYLWLLGLNEVELVELSQADPKRINLSEDDLRWIKCRQADHQWEETCKDYLQWVNTSTANIEDARFLKNTYLGGAWGLTKEQLAACEKKGAIRGTDQKLWEMQDPSPPVPRDHDMATVLEQLAKGEPIPMLPNADQRLPSPPHRPEGFPGPRRTYGGILRIPSGVRYVSGEYTVKYVQRSRYSLLRSLLRPVVLLLLLIPFSIFAPKVFSLPSSLLLSWWIGSSVGVLGLLAVAGVSYMNYVNDIFVCSNRRITHIQNKFKVEYKNIRSVKINVPTILERFLDVGNVVIETTSYPPQITLRTVDYPFVLLDEIMGIKAHKEKVDRARRENNAKKNRHVWLETVMTKLEGNTEGGSVPDLCEKDLLTARSYAQESGLDVAVWGEAEPSMDLPSGYIVHQNPPPGTRMEKGSRVEVVLSKRPAPMEQTQ